MKYMALSAAVILVGVFAWGEASAQTAQAELRNAKGEKVGDLTLTQEADGVKVAVEARNLPPGFHGFHIHAVGKCEPPFTSAGGHFNPGNQTHSNHAGDLPNLLVNADGKASAVLKTARFKVADLFDVDGSALIIHDGPDNHANIPSRYRPDPDQATLSTGDAGGRIACGVIGK